MKILVEKRGVEGDLINPWFYLHKIMGWVGGQKLFLFRGNKKNPWYFSTVPYYLRRKQNNLALKVIFLIYI